MESTRRVACVWIETGRAGRLVREDRYTGSEVKESGRDARKDGEFVQRQAWQEQEALERLARWANRFSPLVGITETVQWKQELTRKLKKQQGKHLRRHYSHPADFRLDAWKTEVFWLDITEVCRFFGSERQLAQRMYKELTEELSLHYCREELSDEWSESNKRPAGKTQVSRGARRKTRGAERRKERHGLVVRVAIAGTVGASWAACLTLSKGIRLLPLDKESVREVLRQFPVGCLRLPDETLDLLYRLGLHRLGQLFDLPRGSIAQRLGEQVAYRWDQLLGTVDEPLRVLHPEQEHVAWQLLPGRIRGPEVMSDTFQRLIAGLLAGLKKSSAGVLQVTCTVELSRYGERVYKDAGNTRQNVETIRIGLYRPTTDTEHLSELFRLQWDRLGRVDEVYSLRVALTQVVPMQQKQLSLFGVPPTVEKGYRWQAETGLDGIPPEKLVRLIDRLASRLGKQQVQRAALRPEALPEQAYEIEPLANVNIQRWCRQVLQIGNKTRADKTPVKPERNNRGWLLRQRKFADSRPIWYWKEPLEMQVQMTTGLAVPTDILYRGRWQRVNRYWGPERIESGWWRGRAIRRDYYRLELATGLRFWVYKTLPGNRWFLQGNC